VPVRGNNKRETKIGREAHGNKRGTSEIRFLLGNNKNRNETIIFN
jgi:hypothetical protein